MKILSNLLESAREKCILFGVFALARMCLYTGVMVRGRDRFQFFMSSSKVHSTICHNYSGLLRASKYIWWTHHHRYMKKHHFVSTQGKGSSP